MRCIQVNQFGSSSSLSLHKIAVPVSHPKDTVRIVNKIIGVNPVDVYIRSGKYYKLPQLPYVPGTDGAGVVISSNSSKFKIGDRVWYYNHQNLHGTGSYTEQTIVSDDLVKFLPDYLTFQQGACLGLPYCTAQLIINQLNKSRFLSEKDEDRANTVLIIGTTGGVGSALLELLRNNNRFHLIGTYRNNSGKDFLEQRGIFSVNLMDGIGSSGKESWKEQIKKYLLKENLSLDYIVDLHAHQYLGDDLDLINDHGKILIVGCRGELPNNLSGRAIIQKCLQIEGVNILEQSREQVARLLNQIQGKLFNENIVPIPGKIFPFEMAGYSHEFIVTNNGKIGKTLLEFDRV